MPRGQRKKSCTGIYHVTMRGVNRANIFNDREDFETFRNNLLHCKESSHTEIYAYCLMTNHIHLLIKEGDEELSHTFQRLGAGFVGWYNKKYERVGHLFQSRYFSDVVESDQYLLMVMRYIHQNPVKAGLVSRVLAYEWSSIHEYMGTSRICNTNAGLAYFVSGKEIETARRDFLWAQDYEQANVYEPGTSKKEEFLADVRHCFNDLNLGVPWEERETISYEERYIWAKSMHRLGISYGMIEQYTGINKYRLKRHD